MEVLKMSGTNLAAASLTPINSPSWDRIAQVTKLFRGRSCRGQLRGTKADRADTYTQLQMHSVGELAVAMALRNPIGGGGCRIFYP